MSDSTAGEPRLGFDFHEPGLIEAVRTLGAAWNAAEGPPLGAGQVDLPAALPERGVGDRDALAALTPAVRGATRLGDPGFFAHMDPPTPWVTWAAAMWAASRNQNLLHPDTAPVARQLEQVVVDWLAPFFGMSGGHLVPGSSVANLTGLWAARELRGVTEVVCSDVAHLSIRKAANLLGLRLRTVPVDDAQRMRPDLIGDVSHAAVVLTAGTVAAGALDPLDAAPGAPWRHVDAAWGGALRLSRQHADLLTGIDAADSVSLSTHKWLFQPKDNALVLFRDVSKAHAALSFTSGYLATPNVGVLGSRGAAALPLAATLLSWGRHGLAGRIEHCMELAARLAHRVTGEERLELFGPPVTGVVLWRPVRGTVEAVRAALTRSFVSTAEVRGEPWLRSVAANPMADPDAVVDDVLAALDQGLGRV